MSHSFLLQAFVYLAAAVVAVPVARRLGFGSVLGYLLAGVAIGPHALGWVGYGTGTGDVQRFAEFGVIMMLFLIGLELQPSLLWKLRVPILGLGGLQVLGTVLVTGLAAMALGLGWKPSLAAGLLLAMSSTAIVLQSFQEKGWSRTPGGESGFSILLFQDLSVIPILALLPLLGAARASGGGPAHGIAALSPGLRALAVLAAVAAVITAGRFLSRPVFRFIAGSRLREVFTAAALLLVVGITLLMETVGLSPALGAFLAGVVLADNEYRHELEGDIEPFKGLLLGLFFLSVGAGIDLAYVLSRPLLILGLTAAVMALKAGVLFGLAKAFRLKRADAAMLALSLLQVGEFAFVLIALSGQAGIFTADQARLLVALTAISMAATPPLFLLLERVLLPRFAEGRTGRAMDAIRSDGSPVIIAGFGRMGNMVGRLLQANGFKTTVLDLNPEVVDGVRKVGLSAYYGDASRLDLLHAAGAEKARLMVLAIDNPEKTLEIAETVKQHFPHLQVLVRAQGRYDAYQLVNRGYRHVFRETFGTAMDMGFEALRALGFRGLQAQRAVQTFKAHNEKSFRELARHWGDDKAYFSLMREKIREADGLFRDPGSDARQVDLAFDNEPLRRAASEGDLKR